MYYISVILGIVPIIPNSIVDQDNELFVATIITWLKLKSALLI